MKALEEKILEEGVILPGNVLKVGTFLNHQIDAGFVMQMGEEIAELFREDGVTRILTIEASGIAIAMGAAVRLGVPMVYAKKGKTSNISSDVFSSTVHSYTRNVDITAMVEKQYIKPGDRVLIVDDFLANGGAVKGLMDIISQAGAQLVGVAVGIEKGFQGGGDALRARGIKVESLAVIDSMEDGKLIFRH